jgi:hypothetical protein
VHPHAFPIDFEVIMFLSYWSRVSALALLPLAAMAQQGQQASPADPEAPVPASTYLSVFKEYRSGTDAQGTPDQAWRSANEAVAGKEAHAGHGPMPASPEKDITRTPAAPADPHAGHGSHH